MSWAGRAQQCCCYSLFIGALRFCFTGDELGVETTSQPLLRRLLCPWEGERDRLCCDHSGGLGEQLGAASALVCLLQTLEFGARLPKAHGPVKSGHCCAVSRIFPLLGTLFLDFPRTIWASFPTLPFLFLLSSLLPALPFFQSLFFLLFLYSDYQTQG